MRYSYLRPGAALPLVLSAMVSVGAQERSVMEIRGSVRSQQQAIFQGLQVEIVPTSGVRQTWRADISVDGSFAFREVPVGDYVLRVVNRSGGVIEETLVSVRDHSTELEVHLPREDRAKPGRRISLRQLQHPPTREAMKAVAAAQKFARSGDDAKAVAELQKAVRLSPDFAGAHTNLGAEYMRLHDYQRARQEIELALQIAGPNGPDLCNLAFLDAVEGRIPEAVEAARASVRADPGNAQAHYLLGTLLLQERRTVADGVRELEEAAPALPAAREMLERVRAASRNGGRP